MKKDKAMLLAYTAGIIDGEGTIGIRKKTYEIDPSRMFFVPRIVVGMITAQPLDLLFGLFGGAIRIRKSGSLEHPEITPMFVWEISSEKAGKVAKQVLPFLRVKREQAQILIRMQGRINKGKKIWLKNHIRISEHELEKRKELYLQMKKLNLAKSVYPRAGATTKQIKLGPDQYSKTLISDSLISLETLS